MTSRAIVIDACVARAAGPENSAHPTSRACRAFLVAVMKHGHGMVSSGSIREEWNKHQSGFARTWRVAMVARKRVENIEDRENPTLREAIREGAPSRKDADAILKDIHLFEAAAQTGKCIASVETRCFELMESLPAIPAAVRELEIVRPDAGEDAPVEWLREGAKSSRCQPPFCRRLTAGPRST